MDFTNKIVLVTGASRGIGRAIAKQFADRGATILVHYNSNRAAAEETAASLPGSNHMVLQADMKDAEGLKVMVETAVSARGRIDILINNAGIYENHPLADTDYATWQSRWQKIISTNLIGVANLTYCVGQQMITQEGGRIVNISSRGAFRGEPTSPAYGASKAGLNAMSQSLAKYLAPYNIFVGVVAPGFVQTDMAKSTLNSPEGDGIRNQSPLKRVATPDEVAYAAVFLASEGAQFMTGAIIDVNGASYLRT
ncbi:MAG: SDR family oxidoreductase [Chloroflexi bacterium]|nr:SDR family oxidoreductase [Chloroflexota bacterium]